MSQEKNVVKVRFSQDLDYTTPERDGKPGKHIIYFNEVEFKSETVRGVKALNVSSWLFERMEHFMAVSRLQGKVGFKLSKDIKIEVICNNKNLDEFSMKFSMAIPRIQRILERNPQLIARAFVTPSNVADATPQLALKNVNLMRTGNVELLPPIKEAVKQQLIEAGLPLIGAE